MNVSIQEVGQEEKEEILIRCHEINENVMLILHKIKESQDSIIGMVEEEIHRLTLDQIYYFEVVENRSFLYGQHQVYSTKLRLYEFEQISAGSRFFRATKSTMVNSSKISYVKPSMSGRFEATLKNGEKVLVSRQYVPELKKLLGL